MNALTNSFSNTPSENANTDLKLATMKLTHWVGKRVWIIGASTGIGRALAQRLLAKGATVYVSARNEIKLAALAAQHDNCTALPLDTTDAKALTAAYQSICAQGGLDVYIHAAAIYDPMRIEEFDADTIHHAMQVNYGGVIQGLQATLPDLMAAQSGHIAIIASVAGYVGMPNALAYGPTKAALINLCENLYADLHDKGVAVHVINPGFVESPLTAKNSFKMPAIITAEQAADAIIKGFAKGQFEITFPKRFTYGLKLVQRLPYVLKLKFLKKLSQPSHLPTSTLKATKNTKQSKPYEKPK